MTRVVVFRNILRFKENNLSHVVVIATVTMTKHFVTFDMNNKYAYAQIGHFARIAPIFEQKVSRGCQSAV